MPLLRPHLLHRHLVLCSRSTSRCSGRSAAYSCGSKLRVERSGAERLLPALAKVKIWSVKVVERWGGALLFFGLEPDTDGLSWSSSSNKALSAAVGTLSKPSTLSRSQPSSKKASFLEELK